nr:reverse transcriptase domain-containing protein [Tanacetum cinerariifolium]
MSSNMASSSGSGTLPSNTVTNPKEDLKGITTRSGVAYKGPTVPTPSKVVKQGTESTKDPVQTTSPQSTAHVQPLVTQSETPVSEPIDAPVSALMPNLKPSIPYPSRRETKRRREQANEQIEKLYEIFKDMSFEISFTDALILMPKFASTLKAFIRNKEKLNEMARTPMNEHCSTVILNKLPKKVGDVGKFLIPCEFPRMDYPTPSDDPIVSTTSPTLTPFGDSDFLLFEEANAFLGLEDDPDSLELDPSYYDSEGDIQMLESILNRSGTLPGNTVTNPKEDLKGITTRSGVAYQGHTTPTPSKVAKQGTEVTKDQVQTSNPQITAPVQPTVTQSKPKTLVYEPVVAPVSAPMPNLKPSIPYPSRHDTERRHRTKSKPVGIANDVKLKVGMFHFPADFVVVDFEPDPQVPLILGWCFLKIIRALIDVHKGELTLRIKNKAITYNLDQTSRYSTNYDQMTTNKIDVTDEV